MTDKEPKMTQATETLEALAAASRAKCPTCGGRKYAITWSGHRHDFKWCSCKSVAVDGGLEYLRRLGNMEDFEELSEYDD